MGGWLDAQVLHSYTSCNFTLTGLLGSSRHKENLVTLEYGLLHVTRRTLLLDCAAATSAAYAIAQTAVLVARHVHVCNGCSSNHLVVGCAAADHTEIITPLGVIQKTRS